ncbi:MAG: hypothetical protein WDN10_02860 [bacterium]
MSGWLYAHWPQLVTGAVTTVALCFTALLEAMLENRGRSTFFISLVSVFVLALGFLIIAHTRHPEWSLSGDWLALRRPVSLADFAWGALLIPGVLCSIKFNVWFLRLLRRR